MSFQEVAILIIGVLTIGYVGWKVYRFLTRPDTADPCAGCAGCALKEELKAKNNCISPKK
ncbi:FeoB-associated Cys-rich membrane protein [Parabacteroides sp. PF5-6]|uniref:FeoB-associated Cys-rich membrane protein n=1 Tax=Parabacteroides sp. PF5-6 TaxID=1742403 RepID=UPI002405C34A|nr:FeoB-associated Cys-rich membrane protein [Parabacteroides sp. PF5-6]MDF9829863.1 hypothetical protein [Parabacteroides sp. PF5-6]